MKSRRGHSELDDRLSFAPNTTLCKYTCFLPDGVSMNIVLFFNVGVASSNLGACRRISRNSLAQFSFFTLTPFLCTPSKYPAWLCFQTPLVCLTQPCTPTSRNLSFEVSAAAHASSFSRLLFLWIIGIVGCGCIVAG